MGLEGWEEVASSFVHPQILKKLVKTWKERRNEKVKSQSDLAYYMQIADGNPPGGW